MKNFDLKACGVSEISEREMKEVNGGWFWVGIVLGLLIAECLDKNAANDFEEGRQAARDFWDK